jgi:5-carboxymethyl-2-hydroxymuconate isomerase
MVAWAPVHVLAKLSNPNLQIMPHLIIEHTQNISALIEQTGVLIKAHKVLVESGLFNPSDIKSRIYPAGHSLVGTQGIDGSFCHAWVYLLEGRTVEQKEALSQMVFNTLVAALPEGISLSVDVQEMSRSTYKKN